MCTVLLVSSTSYARVSFGEMRGNLESGGWTVHLSKKYGPLEAGLVGACIYFTGGAGTLPCLGDVLTDIAQTIGWDLLSQAIQSRGQVIFGPGGLQAEVGTSSHDFLVTQFPRIYAKNHFVYVKYRRVSHGNPAPAPEPAPENAIREACIQNPYLASVGRESYLSDNGTFWGSCDRGERWTVIPQGDGNYCIQNILLSGQNQPSFLSDNGTFWGNCDRGEKWTVVLQSDGTYCIQNILLGERGQPSYLSDNGTFWGTCAQGERWVLK